MCIKKVIWLYKIFEIKYCKYEIRFFYFQLQYRRKGDENWNVVEPEVKDGKGNQFIVEHPIEELQPGSYEAILTARNAFGWSPPSEPHMFTGGSYIHILFIYSRYSMHIRYMYMFFFFFFSSNILH